MTVISAIKRALSKPRLLNRKFKRNEDGATAVEFALIATPFIFMIVGVFELAAVFLVKTQLENATHEAARQIRTGQFTGGADDFKELVCDLFNEAKASDCLTKTTVGLVTAGDFSSTTSFAPVPPTGTDYTIGGVTVVVTVGYKFKLILPGNMTKLGNDTDNTRQIKVASAFRNEPF